MRRTAFDRERSEEKPRAPSRGPDTLSERRSAQPVTFFDLERPQDLARLGDPELALGELGGLVVLDEIQRLPGLFPVLRVLVDRLRARVRFLVLGSASPDLLRQSSETLAGRLWLRGGFPRSFTARSLRDSAAWRADFIRTFLERDVPQLGLTIPAATLWRFWTMLAHYHGQVWNASEFARAFGVTDHTVRRYLDVLASTFVVRVLQPWTEDLRKRQVKSPKVYLSDPGLLHSLLGLETLQDLTGHPKVGASWEGLMLGLVAERLGVEPEECHFWATHAGAELDLVIVRGRLRLGFEFKRTAAPRLTPSMRTALADLRLARLDVVHAGSETFPLAPRIRAVAARRILEDVEPLR